MKANSDSLTGMKSSPNKLPSRGRAEEKVRKKNKSQVIINKVTCEVFAQKSVANSVQICWKLAGNWDE